MKNVACVVQPLAVHLRIFNSAGGFAARCVFTSESVCLPSCSSVWERRTFTLSKLTSECLDVLGKGLFACMFLKHQLIRVGVLIGIQHKEMHLFYDCSELSFQGSTMVTRAVPSSVCQVPGKDDVFKA